MSPERLKRKVLVGSAWSLLGNGGQQLLSFALFIYLARLLTPADIGIVTLAMALVEVLAYVVRCGQVEWLQQRGELDDDEVSTSFWILAVAGGVVSALLMVIGLAMPNDPPSALGTILPWLAPVCALQTLNAVPEALTKRRLDFRPLALRSWMATLAGGAAAVVLVHRGFGVHALVGQRLATALVQTWVLWALVGWRPRWTLSTSAVRPMVAEGVRIMLAGCAGLVNQRAAEGIVGVSLGAAALGLLRLGWRFFDFAVQFAVTPVAGVALSSFSRLQHDLPQLRRAYLRLTQVMAMASLPLFFGFAAVADLCVPIVFGPQWDGSVTVLQMIALAILPGSINFFFAPALIAVGRSRVVLRQAIVQVVMTVVLVAFGTLFGLVGAMAAIVTRASLVSLYNLHALRKGIGLSYAAVARVLMPPLVASAVMAGAVLWLKRALSGSISEPVLLAFLVGAGAATYGGAFMAGDRVGAWSGYLRGVVDAVAASLKPEPAISHRSIRGDATS